MESHVDETKCVINSSCLHKSDIPGVLLGDWDPNSFKILELKHWLTCRNVSTKGKQVDTLTSKNQALQILYLKHHAYKVSYTTMDRNPQKFDPHKIKQPYCIV